MDIKLEKGAYYYGLETRADTKIEARWNGQYFIYWNFSFGQWYQDILDSKETCGRFACFIPEKILLPNEVTKEIILYLNKEEII